MLGALLLETLKYAFLALLAYAVLMGLACAFSDDGRG